jgi:hypothetical protein
MTGVIIRTLMVLPLLLILVPAPAGAQRSEGLALYRQGSELYEAGRYRAAIDHFKRSLAIYRHKNTLYALGEAYRRLGQLRRSHHYYQRYASMLPDGERGAFEKKLERMLGEARSEISITTEPPGATVMVDGEIRGSTPPRGALRLTLRAGEHLIGVKLAGHRPASRAVTAQFGEPMGLHLRLRPRTKKRPPRAPARPGRRIRAFVGLLAGVAATDFSDDSLEVNPAFVLDLEGGAMFFRRGRFGLTGSASLSYSGFRDDVVDDSAAFLNLVFNLGGRIFLGSRFWFELRFGLGPSILVGAEADNFLLQRYYDQQTFTGLVARPALCAFWSIRRGVTLHLRLFALDYSPRLGGFAKLAPSITSIKRFTFGLGLGWHS